MDEFTLLFYGALSFLALYNLFIYLLFKEKDRLFYVLYMVSWVLYWLVSTRSTRNAIDAAVPFIGRFVFESAVGWAIICYLQFMRLFLMTSKKYRSWDTFLKGFIIFFIAFWLISITATHVLGVSYNFFNGIGNTIILLFGCVIVVFTVRVALKNDRVERYFVLGNISFFGGLLGAVALQLTFGNEVQRYIIPLLQSFILIEVLFFALGLGAKNKRNELQKRKAQHDLIMELEKNAILQKETNEQLELKVRERTAEITSQNEELVAQRDFIEERNKELTEKNRMINDSIRAAKRIQRAVLSNKSMLEEIFSSCFLLDKPRDVVSGDFYWVKQYDQIVWLVLADCTGHGVPGAFMTLLGNSILDEIITQNNYNINPAEMLSLFDTQLKSAMRNQMAETHAMDMVMLKIQYNDGQDVSVEFAGAKMHLYVYEKTAPTFITYKGNRRTIGIDSTHQEDFMFESLGLSRGDVLYLATDGYQDQNNIERRKIGRVRFATLLEENAQKTLSEQKEVLENKLIAHMQSTEQRDDILVLGVEL